MPVPKLLANRATRKRFLDRVAGGTHLDDVAAETGISMRTAQRYAENNAPFRAAFIVAKKKGRAFRFKLAGHAVPKPKRVEAPRDDIPLRCPPPDQEPAPAGAVSPVYLEQMEAARPGGLQLNPGLPPLSVKTFLAKCQSLLHDDKAPVALRVAALKQIGAHTLLPILCPPPRSETATGADTHARAAIPGGVRVQVVTMEAPNNGLYAPGRAPGQAQVVDDAEADDAEVVEARSS